jgi:hypothetical protein
LKRQVSNKWTTHFLVLEEALDRGAPPLEEHESARDEKMAVGSRIFKRVPGAGKVNHEDKDLELMKAAEWMKIVLVWRASMPFEAQLPSEHTNLAGSVYFVAHELQP